MMTCPNCKRTIKAIESINGVTGEVSVNFCPGCGTMMSGTNYEADNASCLQLYQSLLEKDRHITITRVNIPSDVYEDNWCYRVDVTDGDGTILASGEGYPLTEAMSLAYMSTPESKR